LSFGFGFGVGFGFGWLGGRGGDHGFDSHALEVTRMRLVHGAEAVF